MSSQHCQQSKASALKPIPKSLTNEEGNRAVDDKVRFANVVLPNLDDAFTLATWLTGNRTDAEDVVQQACIRAFRGICGYSGRNARAWTLRVVRNTAYSWLLKTRPTGLVFAEDLNKVEQLRLEHPAPCDGPTMPETLLVARIGAQALRDAIATLPAPFREVIVLRELQECNYREIAEIIDAPIGTVMSRLSRARNMLVAALAKV